MIVDDVLASIAARYVTLPSIHVIGGVFTRRKYRGRGYATAVVSALTREAISAGALAGLHVLRGLVRYQVPFSVVAFYGL